MDPTKPFADCQAWAADIRRTRHIGDFTGWNHDRYAPALVRLLRDLKAGAAAPSAARKARRGRRAS